MRRSRSELSNVERLVMCLWLNFNWSTYFYKLPNFIHLSISYRDTAVSPIKPLTYPRQPAKTVFLAVNHNISAWVNACGLSSLNISFVWIGDMNSFIKRAIRLFKIKDVFPFGRSFIPLFLFVTFWVCTKNNIIFLGGSLTLRCA